MTTLQAPQTQALILLLKTMPPLTQQEFVKYVTEHQADFVSPDELLAEERNDFFATAHHNLARAYSDDEPEYSLNDVIEPNPDYVPQ